MSQTSQAPNKPELKIGPFAGGISVDLWKNTINTDDGPRIIRSFTISPRQYRDADHQWKDSSYRITDAPVIQLALEKLSVYLTDHPLPDEGEPGF